MGVLSYASHFDCSIIVCFFTQSQILEPHIQPLPSSATMIQHVDRVDAVPGLDDRLWERQQVSENVEALEFIYDINLVLK